MARRQLSILIPTYNDSCLSQVHALLKQAESVDGLHYEIIVGNDCSTSAAVIVELNEIATLPHCQVLTMTENVGRASIRNQLARAAQFEWLLFIDACMEICTADYLANYLEAGGEVVYGGNCLPEATASLQGNLRFRYEQRALFNGAADLRRLNPDKDFHTCNFLVKRSLYLAHPLDERFRHYGYEDVFWGKQLKEAKVEIHHINNPTLRSNFEDNALYLEKTETAMRTLAEFKEELHGYSDLLSFTERLHQYHLTALVKQIYGLTKNACRKNLLGRHPSLKIFSFYKLGYFLSLTFLKP